MPDAGDPAPRVGVSLCVLASGSQGNCSVLVARPAPDAPRRVVLIDAGLSPRRTARLLIARGIRPDEVDDVVFTHLDTDHCHAGWAHAIRPGGWRARLRIHRRHLGRAERIGLLYSPAEPFDDRLRIGEGLHAESCLEAHDDLGVAALRFVAATAVGEAHVGYATDVGRVTNAMLDLLRGVDMLAIESNYCPVMQAESDRPQFLKDRITGGAGHLSNQESADAARAVAPGESLVLLHLSRQCNTPVLARRAHAQTSAEPVITDQFEPTPWLPVRGQSDHARVAPPAPTVRVRSLFDLAGNGGAAW